jgi:hypothetical protein
MIFVDDSEERALRVAQSFVEHIARARGESLPEE